MLSLVEHFVQEVVRSSINSVEFTASTQKTGADESNVCSYLYMAMVVAYDAPLYLIVTTTNSSASIIPAREDIITELFPESLEKFKESHAPENDSEVPAVETAS